MEIASLIWPFATRELRNKVPTESASLFLLTSLGCCREGPGLLLVADKIAKYAAVPLVDKTLHLVSVAVVNG
jgi:hypothetical protein